MSYSVISTPGFIVHSEPRGEAGKIFWIFTRELGLVLATAQGIRLEKSKLRYAAQDYSLGKFAFIRGKEFWRLTDARELDAETPIVPSQLKVRVAELLRRLLNGEEPHPSLFENVQTAIKFLETHKLQIAQMEMLESLIVARILYLLGYIAEDKDIEQLTKNVISLEILDELKDKRVLINKHINKALTESQL